ncbi:uncharacterized protein BCR38DRAFT_447583 [Pseudomassariella vexata]|uniref:Uncharacterized protein n=1 Tax=Pseudomassariella vexata TaxID=1141098 RepID=A0A1Y2DH22_9PEZI|nr:uncharacterized protein BCR38DRAFT_447583 [Pseudomassariella vexata]ORY58537.1 hypothetical protein BCR38DRAFT_447583 [Pseudomassariella vexata]
MASTIAKTVLLAPSAFVLLSGVLTLVFPHTVTGTPQLAGTPPAALNILGVSSVGLGLVLTHVALKLNKEVFYLNIVGRAVAVVAFWHAGPPLQRLAGFEGIMGLATAAALRYV